MEKTIRYNNLHFQVVAPSTHKNKKYDVFHNSKYLVSFGDNRYQQYHDKIGYYSHLDHKNPQRRQNYRLRHSNDISVLENDPCGAGWWSWHYLW